MKRFSEASRLDTWLTSQDHFRGRMNQSQQNKPYLSQYPESPKYESARIPETCGLQRRAHSHCRAPSHPELFRIFPDARSRESPPISHALARAVELQTPDI